MYLRNLCKIHVSGSVFKHPYVSQDPLQDPCLRFMSQHLYISGPSARSMSPDSCFSIYIADSSGSSAILCKIHVSDSCLSIFISQGPLQDPCLRIHVSASLYLRILCKIHVSGSIYQHPYVSQDPLQDPCLQAHVSASLHPRILYKIHVFGFMSQHLRISGSSARSMCPIHVLALMSQHPCVSQEPLQDPCLRIHISAAICISGSSTRSTSSDSCLSIFVSHGFSARSTSPDSCLSIFVSQDPLQDPCLRVHVSDSCLSIHQYGSSARSMSPDSCLSIVVSQDSLQDPCLRIHVSAATNLDPLQGSFCKIHVSDSCLSILIIRFCGRAQAKRIFWPPEARSVWPCAGKTVRPSVSRRRNANFDLPRRIFCGPAQAKRKFDLPRRVLWPYHVESRGVTTRWTKIATALQRDAKNFSQQPFRAGETQILTSGVAFFVALRSEKQADRKFTPRPKRLYSYRKNPSVRHTIWGKMNFQTTCPRHLKVDKAVVPGVFGWLTQESRSICPRLLGPFFL